MALTKIIGDGVGTVTGNITQSKSGTITNSFITSSTDSYAELLFQDGNAGYALQVRSDNAQSTGTGSFLLNDRDTGSFPVVIKEGNASNTLVLSGSKIGIGTNAPLDLVHLKGGSDNSSTGAPIIRLQKQSGGAVDDGQTIGGISWFVNDDGVQSGASYERAKIIAESQNSSSGTRLEFWTGNSNADIAERMRIIADGSVLIGTTTGSEKLVVSGNFNATTGIKSLGVYNNTTGTGANVVVDSAGGFARSTSSRRYKNTINDATHGLTELLALRSVTYKGNNDGDTLFGGLIAEEVHDAGLTEFVTYNDDNEPDALAYGNIVSLCIKAIQELSTKNDALETKNDALEARIKTLEDA